MGREIFLDWLREPVDPDTIGNDLGLHLIRFAMMEDQLPPEAVRAFLTELAAALARFVDGLERYLASGEAPATRHATLALEHGIAVHRASIDWAREALRRLSAPQG